MSTLPHEHLSDEDAEKEYQEIQAEIAKEKGQDPDKKDPEEEGEHKEPEDQDEPGEDDDKSKRTEHQPREKSQDVDPDKEPEDGKKDMVPLSKYQDTKKTLEGENATLQSEVERLTLELNQSNTKKAIGDKVKAYAEKHGMSEEAALDLVMLVKGENALDADTKVVIEKSQNLIKKQEAEEKFNQELADFINEFPEAADQKDVLRAKAFEKDNLNRSLFEIYHRFAKPEESAPKKKTGEASRPARSTVQTFDVKTVAERVSKGVAKPFDGLSEAQVDEVFDYMEKHGSRYTNK